MDSNNSVYVRMMVDVLKRKEKILQRILKQTKEQEVMKADYIKIISKTVLTFK